MSRRARWAVGLVLPAALLVGLVAVQRRAEPAHDAPTAVVAPTADCLSARVLDRPGSGRGRRGGRRGHAARGRPGGGPRPGRLLAGQRRRRARPAGRCTTRPARGWRSPRAVARATSPRSSRRCDAPSAQRGGTCSTATVVPPALWLVDALGRAIRPVWPTDRCGSPQAAVTDALDALEEIDSEQYPVRLVVARRTGRRLTAYRACAAGPARPSGRRPWSAPASRGCGWAGCSARGSAALIESQIRSARVDGLVVGRARRTGGSTTRAGRTPSARSDRKRSTYHGGRRVVRAST